MRRDFGRRLAALEARSMLHKMPFKLEDGRTVNVDIRVVLGVFTGAARWAYPDGDDPIPDGPLDPDVELLSRAVTTPDDGLLAASVVQLARQARDVAAGLTPPERYPYGD